jgi:hypothetical protein
MAYPDPKGDGDKSMPGKRRSRPDGWSDASGGPHDMAKSGLTESQSPGTQTKRPSENRLQPAPYPCVGIPLLSTQLPGCGRYPARVYEEMSGAPKSCCYV